MSHYFGGAQPKRTENYNSFPEYYKFFKSRNPKTKVKPIEYNKIVRKFNLTVRDLIVERGFEWSTFGIKSSIKVVKYKRKIKEVYPGRFNLPVDKQATWKLRQENPEAPPVYHLNHHSNGYTCKILWVRSNYPKSLRSYIFVRCARFKKQLSDAIINRDSLDNYFEANAD
jgi:hypothetical protein